MGLVLFASRQFAPLVSIHRWLGGKEKRICVSCLEPLLVLHVNRTCLLTYHAFRQYIIILIPSPGLLYLDTLVLRAGD